MTGNGETTWLQRNTRWLVLGAVLGGLLVLACLALGILMLVVTAVRSSDAYQTSVMRAQTDPHVLELLGAPIEPGLFVRGSIRVENQSGDADLTIPLSGSHGQATLYVVADRQHGQWQYRRMYVQTEGPLAAEVDLLTPEPQQLKQRNEK
jgi:hypothetical protein